MFGYDAWERAVAGGEMRDMTHVMTHHPLMTHVMQQELRADAAAHGRRIAARRQPQVAAV